MKKNFLDKSWRKREGIGLDMMKHTHTNNIVMKTNFLLLANAQTQNYSTI